MTDKLLERYTNRDPMNSGNGHDQPDETEVDDLGSFGFLRGSRERAVMLELRKKDGNILAVSYGYMDKAEFDPSEGITLHVAGQKIRIRGRNLNTEALPKVKLFEGLTRHRIPWVREATEHESMAARKGTPVIDAIEW